MKRSKRFANGMNENTMGQLRSNYLLEHFREVVVDFFPMSDV